MSTFENVFDVLEFVVHHLPTGFVDLEHRFAAVETVRKANPLTAQRDMENEARIQAEREFDTRGANSVVRRAEQLTTGYSQEQLDAAVAKAVAAALNQNAENKPAPTNPTDAFTVTPGYVPDSDPNA